MTSTILFPETSICTFRLETPCCLGRLIREGLADRNEGEPALLRLIRDVRILDDHADAVAKQSAAQNQNDERDTIEPLPTKTPHPHKGCRLVSSKACF
jgi:hypothetical protein